MDQDIDRVLIGRQQIARRVRELAEMITADHASVQAGGGQVVLVPILTGAMIFCADLMRQMPIAMRIGLLTVSSYPGSSLGNQGSSLVGQQLGEVRGRHVVLIDDILDSGGTLGLVIPHVQSLGPASMKTCVLLRKDRPAARRVNVDYVGFEIPNVFVVGYGLDYDTCYRNLPEIVTLKQQRFARTAP
jgi:hypoxanthine phosphoribosyltransferase